MKKYLSVIFLLGILTTCATFAATKYTVNTSGVVKNSGQVQSPTSNTINQNYYNNYSATNYVNNNVVNQSAVNTIEFVMDYSGSMANWIGVAKRSMSAIVAQIPSDVSLGFRVFGHDNFGNNPTISSKVQEVKKIIKKGSKYSVVTKSDPIGNTTGACAATSQVTPIMSANVNALLGGMNAVNIGGSTPLVYALDRAVNQDFAQFDTVTPKKIVLITDGGENCGGDPCEFARRLVAKRSDIHIDVVLVSSSSRALSCLATTTGGNFYTLNNLSDFSRTINKSIQTAPNPVVNQPQSDKQYYEFIN